MYRNVYKHSYKHEKRGKCKILLIEIRMDDEKKDSCDVLYYDGVASSQMTLFHTYIHTYT